MVSRDDLAVLLSKHLAATPGIAQQQKMGAANFTVHDKVFSFVGKSGLVMKLPEARIDQLEDAGRAEHLVMGKRVCKEWALFKHQDLAAYRADLPLLGEAKAFVESEAIARPEARKTTKSSPPKKLPAKKSVTKR